MRHILRLRTGSVGSHRGGDELHFDSRALPRHPCAFAHRDRFVMTPGPETATTDEAVRQRRAALVKLFSRVGEMSSLPTVAVRIIQVADDEQASVDELLSAIEGDPAMVVRILRIVNSGFYGLRTRVGDVRHAVTLLGLKKVRGLALTLYVSRMFRASGHYRGYSREGLWGHQVAVACAARLIADFCPDVSPDEAYVAGLLHDIGYVLMDEHMRPQFKQVIDILGPEVDTVATERKILSFDHCLLGAFVLNQWGLPDQVVRAAAYHHSPLEYAGAHRTMVCLVSLANYFCSFRGITSLGVHNAPQFGNELYAQLGLTEGKAEAIVEQLDDSLSAAANTASA